MYISGYYNVIAYIFFSLNILLKLEFNGALHTTLRPSGSRFCVHSIATAFPGLHPLLGGEFAAIVNVYLELLEEIKCPTAGSEVLAS